MREASKEPRRTPPSLPLRTRHSSFPNRERSQSPPIPPQRKLLCSVGQEWELQTARLPGTPPGTALSATQSNSEARLLLCRNRCQSEGMMPPPATPKGCVAQRLHHSNQATFPVPRIDYASRAPIDEPLVPIVSDTRLDFAAPPQSVEAPQATARLRHSWPNRCLWELPESKEKETTGEHFQRGLLKRRANSPDREILLHFRSANERGVKPAPKPVGLAQQTRASSTCSTLEDLLPVLAAHIVRRLGLRQLAGAAESPIAPGRYRVAEHLEVLSVRADKQ